MTKIDQIDNCWYFDLQPGQTVVKTLHLIDIFEAAQCKARARKYYIIDHDRPDDYSLMELLTPQKLSKKEKIGITISRGTKSVYGDPEKQHGLCYYYNFDKFYTFVFVNPNNDCTFCAKVKFKLDNYSLIQSEDDTVDTWNIELKPKEKTLKLMKKMSAKKNSSWNNSTSFKFIMD